MSSKVKAIIGFVVVAVVVALVVIFVVLRMPSNTNSSTTTSTKSAVESNTVSIKGYAYMPATIKVKVGTKVTWTNEDNVKHTVTANDDSAVKFGSELLAKGETYSYTFNQAGTFSYYCLPHPYMKGTVVVTQ